MQTLYTDQKLNLSFTKSYFIGWLFFIIGTYQYFFGTAYATNPYTTLGIVFLVHYIFQVKDDKPHLIAWGLWFPALIVQLAQVVSGYQFELVLPLGLIVVLALANHLDAENEIIPFLLMMLIILMPFEWRPILVTSTLVMAGLKGNKKTRYPLLFFGGLMAFYAFHHTGGLSLAAGLGTIILSGWKEEERYTLPFLNYMAIPIISHAAYFLFGYLLLSIM